LPRARVFVLHVLLVTNQIQIKVLALSALKGSSQPMESHVYLVFKERSQLELEQSLVFLVQKGSHPTMEELLVLLVKMGSLRLQEELVLLVRVVTLLEVEDFVNHAQLVMEIPLQVQEVVFHVRLDSVLKMEEFVLNAQLERSHSLEGLVLSAHLDLVLMSVDFVDLVQRDKVLSQVELVWIALMDNSLIQEDCVSIVHKVTVVLVEVLLVLVASLVKLQWKEENVLTDAKSVRPGLTFSNNAPLAQLVLSLLLVIRLVLDALLEHLPLKKVPFVTHLVVLGLR